MLQALQRLTGAQCCFSAGATLTPAASPSPSRNASVWGGRRRCRARAGGRAAGAAAAAAAGAARARPAHARTPARAAACGAARRGRERRIQALGAHAPLRGAPGARRPGRAGRGRSTGCGRRGARRRRRRGRWRAECRRRHGRGCAVAACDGCGCGPCARRRDGGGRRAARRHGGAVAVRSGRGGPCGGGASGGRRPLSRWRRVRRRGARAHCRLLVYAGNAFSERTRACHPRVPCPCSVRAAVGPAAASTVVWHAPSYKTPGAASPWHAGCSAVRTRPPL